MVFEACVTMEVIYLIYKRRGGFKKINVTACSNESDHIVYNIIFNQHNEDTFYYKEI